MTNNFDTSTSGINLDLFCIKHTDASRVYFEENFHVIQHSGYRKSCILFYTCEGEFEYTGYMSDYYKLEGTVKENLIAWYKWEKGVNSLSFSDYRDLLERCQSFDDSFLSRWTIEGVRDFIESECYRDEIGECLQEIATPLFEKINITGYSPSDCATVIIPKEVEWAFNEEGEVKSEYRQAIENIVYNAPVYCRLNVDDEEYYLDEGLNDTYDYEKDEIVEHAKKLFDSHEKKEHIINWLEENLPDYPDYQ